MFSKTHTHTQTDKYNKHIDRKHITVTHTMAKLFLIMICVCTTCVHLACAQMARKSPQLSDFNQNHRHDIKLRPQGQQRQQRLVLGPAAQAPAAVAASAAAALSDLEYGKQIKQTQLENTKQNYEINQLHRIKRHAGHSHEASVNRINHIEVNPNIGHFIEKLFEQFSNGDSKTMNLIEFEKLMKHLGLDRLIDDKQLNNLIHATGGGRDVNGDGGENRSNSDSNIDSTHHDNHEHNTSDAHSNDTVSRISIICAKNKYSRKRKRANQSSI